MRYSRGFTLIELLVVIAIIGLLSAVVLASLNTARAKSRDATRQETLHTLQTALELYYSDHNAYPSGGWYGSSAGANWFAALSPYLASLPHDPEEPTTCKWDSNEKYEYAYISDGVNYKIVACADIQVPATSPLYDPQRPGIVFMVCQSPTNSAYCGMGV